MTNDKDQAGEYYGQDVHDKCYSPKPNKYASPERLQELIKYAAGIISGIGASEKDTDIWISLIELQRIRAQSGAGEKVEWE